MNWAIFAVVLAWALLADAEHVHGPQYRYKRPRASSTTTTVPPEEQASAESEVSTEQPTAVEEKEDAHEDANDEKSRQGLGWEPYAFGAPGGNRPGGGGLGGLLGLLGLGPKPNTPQIPGGAGGYPYPSAYPYNPYQQYPQYAQPQGFPQYPQNFPRPQYPQLYPQYHQPFPAYPQPYPQQPQAYPQYPQAYPQAYPQYPQAYPQGYPGGYQNIYNTGYNPYYGLQQTGGGFGQPFFPPPPRPPGLQYPQAGGNPSNSIYGTPPWIRNNSDSDRNADKDSKGFSPYGDFSNPYAKLANEIRKENENRNPATANPAFPYYYGRSDKLTAEKEEDKQDKED